MPGRWVTTHSPESVGVFALARPPRSLENWNSGILRPHLSMANSHFRRPLEAERARDNASPSDTFGYKWNLQAQNLLE